MTNVEQNHIINRFLDGELTASEREEVRRLIEESKDFAGALNAAIAIRDAARRMPSSSAPPPDVESRLFQTLFASEGADAGDDTESRGAVPFLAKISGSIRRRGSAVVAATLAIVMILGSVNSLNLTESGNDRESLVVSSERVETGTSVQSPAESAEVGNRSIAAARNRATVSLTSLEERESPDFMESNENDQGVSRQLVSQAVIDPTPELNRPRRAAAPDVSLRGLRISSADLDEELPALSTDVSSDGTRQDEHLSLPKPDDEPGKAFLAAAYRHGVSAVADHGTEIISTQEMNVRIEGHFADRHTVSLSVGQRGIVQNRKTYTMISSVGDPKSGPTTSSLLSENTLELAPEMWAGVGYDYSVARIGRIEIAAGAHVGIGERSIRYGVEIPATIHVTDNVSAEMVPFVARSDPYNQTVHTATSLDNPNQFGEELTPAATTFGAQVGLSVRLNP